jgi:predicted nucleic acid-binding protein
MDVSLRTNTAVITEAFFLLKRSNRGEEGLMKMIEEEFLSIEDTFLSNQRTIFDIMNKYKNVPCTFADANLLAMFENDKKSVIITTDSDFLIYRDSNGKPLNLISPYLK